MLTFQFLCSDYDPLSGRVELVDNGNVPECDYLPGAIARCVLSASTIPPGPPARNMPFWIVQSVGIVVARESCIAAAIDAVPTVKPTAKPDVTPERAIAISDMDSLYL